MEYNELAELKRAYINSILELIFCTQYNIRISETNKRGKNYDNHKSKTIRTAKRCSR